MPLLFLTTFLPCTIVELCNCEILDQKILIQILGLEKMLLQKTWTNKEFGLKNVLKLKKFWSKKIVGQKFVIQKLWGQKNKILIKKIEINSYVY